MNRRIMWVCAILVLCLAFTPGIVIASENSMVNNTIPKDINGIKAFIDAYQVNSSYADDPWVLVALKQGVIAEEEGNYGIGACLINNKTGEVVSEGHNQLFSPYRRSDRHAEMDTLDAYEEKIKTEQPLDPNLTLFTTLEPCPMCLSRILTSGIPNVRYSAPDPYGGMVHLMDNLPPVWKEIAKGDAFTVANCSPDLQELSNNLFLISKEELDGRLINNT